MIASQTAAMAKRPAENGFDEGIALKNGRRLSAPQDGEDEGFEDEFEDEFESDDEVLEAGLDGRPDEEREAEEKRGMWRTPRWMCEYVSRIFTSRLT